MAEPRRYSARETHTTDATLKTNVNASLNRTAAGGSAEQDAVNAGMQAAISDLVDGAPAGARKVVTARGEVRDDGTGRVDISIVMT